MMEPWLQVLLVIIGGGAFATFVGTTVKLLSEMRRDRSEIMKTFAGLLTSEQSQRKEQMTIGLSQLDKSSSRIDAKLERLVSAIAELSKGFAVHDETSYAHRAEVIHRLDVLANGGDGDDGQSD